MLDAIQRQRRERRWAFLLFCALLALAGMLQLAYTFFEDAPENDAVSNSPEAKTGHTAAISPPLSLTGSVRQFGGEETGQ